MATNTVYDVESYPNHTLFVFQDMDSGEIAEFTLSEINEMKEYVKGRTLIGFNNHNYDDKILVSVLEGGVTTDADVHLMTQQIIDKEVNEKLLEHTQRELNNIRFRITNYCRRSIDLRKALYKKEGSLKALEIKYAMPSVEDLPFDPMVELSEDQKDKVRLYCRNDVAATAQLAEIGAKELNLRKYLSKKFGIPVHSEGAPGCAEKILIHTHRERTGSPPLDNFWQFKNNVKRQVCSLESVSNFIPKELHDLKFNNKGTQRLFETVRDITIPCIDGKPETAHLTQKTELYGLFINTGAGGLHSIDPPGDFENVIDYDVSSYYPSIMVIYKIHPQQFDEEFTEIIKEIIDKRLEAKRSGDHTQSNALKLILNSIFGKLNDQYSAFQDPRAMLAVTTTGQFLLLKLIEMMTEAGIKIIGANTDGIQVQTEDSTISDLVAQKWMDLTGLILESTKFSKLTRENKNNYLAIKTDGGLKAKGSFNVQGKPSYNIIKIAKNYWFAYGADPEKTIRECKDLHQFIDSYAAPKNMEVFAGNQKIQQTNRWYKSNKSTMTLFRNNKHNDIARTRLSKAENVRVCNRFEEFPDDIDYEWYIEQASKEIHSITKKTAPPGEMALLAEKMRKGGFIPLPQNGKKNAKGAKLRQNQVWNTYSYNEHHNLGFINGEISGMFTVDIDNPGKLDIPTKYLQSGMVVWRGDGEPQDVRDGKLRGSIVFKSHLCKFIKNSKRVKTKGFELLNNGKTTTCAGDYQGTTYRMEGIPEYNSELEEYLRSTGSLVIDEEFDESLIDMPNGIVDEEEAIRHAVTKLMPEITLKRKESIDGYMLTSQCPYGELHTNGINNNTDFAIHARPIGTVASCFHESCQHQVRMLTVRINSLLAETRPQEIVKFTIPQDRDKTAKSVFDALNGEGRAKLIISSTGTGKSWSASKKILHNIKKGRKTLVVVSTKDEMRQMAKILCQQADIADPSDIRVEMVMKGVSTIRKSTLAVITHHQYLRRMGISRRFLTPTAKWMDENSGEFDAIIDEGQAFLRSLICVIQISSRYSRNSDNNGNPIYRRVEKCPARNTKKEQPLTCDSCHKGYNSNYLEDGYGNQVIEHSHTVRGIPSEKPRDICFPKLNLGSSVEFSTFNITEIKPNSSMRYSTKPLYKKWEKEDTPLFNEELINLINCSVRPYIAKNIIAKRESDGSILYPTYPCGIETIVAQDGLSTFHLKGVAGSVTFMGASFDNQSIKYLQDEFDGELEINRIDQGYESLDRVVIVETKMTMVSSGKVDPTLIDFENNHNIKSLIFTNKRKEMHYARDIWMDQNDKLMSFDGGRYLKEYGNREADYGTIMTYSKSSLGRGMNVPECSLVIVSAESYRPMIGVTPTEFTKEGFQQAQHEEASETIIQNAGRILRGKGRKVIIIQGSDRDRNGDIGQYLQQQLKTSYKETPIDYTRIDFASEKAIINFSAAFIKGEINSVDQLTEESLEKRRNRHIAFDKLTPEDQAQKTKEAVQTKAKRLTKKIKKAKQERTGWKSVQRQIRGWKGINPILPKLRDIYLKSNDEEADIIQLLSRDKSSLNNHGIKKVK